MNKNTFKKRTYKHLQFYRDIHGNYESCSTPLRAKKMKDIRLKTNADGYEFHMIDIDELFEHTLRSLWEYSQFKYHLKTLDAIIDGTTEIFYEMTDCDVPNWMNNQSLLEHLISVKNFTADQINGVNTFFLAKRGGCI